MTAATAYDECMARAEKYARCQTKARKLGNRRMAAHFERKKFEALRAADQWLKHPALSCTISPKGERFRVHSRGVTRAFASTLREAERLAAEHGFRHLDTTECGSYLF